MDINGHLPSDPTSSSIPLNQPPITPPFNKLMSESKTAGLPFLAGILKPENLQKVARGETDHVEIRLTQDLREFMEAIKNNTAVMIETSQANPPVFKFSREVNRLIHDHPVHEFTVTMENQAKGYYRNAVQTEKYSLEDMGAFEKHDLEELAEFFQGNQQSLKETEKEQQAAIDKSYKSSQKKLDQMRDRVRQRQEQNDEQDLETKKEKLSIPQKKVGEGTLFTEIVDKQERASIEAQQQRDQNAEVELKREAKAQNLQKEGERLSMRKRKEF
ncbi:hypothetical protein [Parachlamydia sp. AcF125]|uniref:hypothetical protein n=1 Tax=Parachlamydia sp. AcF125 TaxID=2795736 RepID=UPI001BCA6341|nr:hypothetical protein [Parachlamydia sp. AcF125]MBS4169259.1 hypothetical protein [Parachlamydia sp. AcF125]